MRKGPVIRSYVGGGWYLLSYDAVIEALRDPRFSVDMRNSPILNRMQRMAYRGEKSMLDYPTLLNTDPPDHGRLRKLARTGFLRKYLQSLDAIVKVGAITYANGRFFLFSLTGGEEPRPL